ncbi:ABC transporter ATP-binding protein [Segatella bryantii]|uniref:ABC transporter ATP-binding protein n=1 Tax=Segatella bryantii TaxID=77095 RepID=UPI00285349B7|nr:ABC transporter ATP-binding protein [Segatella bryantii]MDR4930179.1 ABC transporter ATP-binding protein [Segatella bryantii]
MKHFLHKFIHIPKYKYGSRAIMRWLWKAWCGNRKQALLNALVGLVSVAVSLLQVAAFKYAIDVASGVIQGNLYLAIGYISLLVLAGFGLNISSVWIKNILGIKAQNRMQQKMLERILRSEWRGRERMHSGDVLNRLEFDVNNVVVFLTETISSAISVLAMFLGAFFYLFSMDKLLSVLVVIMLPLFVAVSKIYVGQMRKLTRKVRDSDSKVQSVLQETIQHRMLIKTMESDVEMVNRLENTQSELRGNVIRKTKFTVLSNFIINFGFAFGYLVAFFWAAVRLSRHTLSFGGMTAFLQLVNKIQGPARDLTKLIPAFVSVFTAAERLMELEENPLEEQGEPIFLDAPCGIRLNHVTYSYNQQDDEVIKDLNFDFKPGSSTAILGETGAGKTTLIRLILALIKPQKGTVEIYNEDVSNPISPRHRCNLVYVPQGNTLMSGTIRDNLKLGKQNATEEELQEVLRLCCADFVYDLPKGLDTPCSERGAGLSEGQAQRITIARSLLRNRSIMLFDEATSALDPETEKQVLHNLLCNHRKTVIFITHRPAVKEYCDQILKIKKI